jgi:hypothetical protein
VESKPQNSAHGWRGNTTDEKNGRPNIKINFFIRGIATPSVGLDRFPDQYND